MPELSPLSPGMISGLTGAGGVDPAGNAGISRIQPNEAVGPAFGEVLSGVFDQVNGAQMRADSMVEALALGEPVEIHQVMLALNEASNAMSMTMQVRNKALEAYQELMRMPL